MSSVPQIIEEIIARQFVSQQVSPNTRLAGEANQDMTPLLRVVLAVEEAFPIVISDPAIKRFVTVQDLIDHVEMALEKSEPEKVNDA